MGQHSQQERYWNELVQLKAQACYLNSYQLQCEGWDNRLKMFLAIASSSSIAGWAVWQKLGFLWAFIIATSQVLSAIRHNLPWERRAREIAGLGTEVATILLSAERNWYAVASGHVPESGIHELTMELKKRRNEAESKHLQGHPLPEKERHKKAAVERTVEYFRTHYGLGGS